MKNISKNEKVKTISLTDVYDLGSKTFGGLHDFVKWLINPQNKFLDQAPIDLLETEKGINEVYGVLQNIFPKSRVICISCKDEFTTDNPKKNGACECGNIWCDVNENYIRVLDCFNKGYKIEENGKIIHEEVATTSMDGIESFKKKR